MDRSSKLSVSVALIVVVCFFLPWVQVSCGGAHDTSSGVDLARGGDHGLWLIPVLMLAIILLGLMRVFAAQRPIFGFIGLLSGLISSYLMNHERWRFADSSGLIAVRLTGWFWLAFLSSLALTILGAVTLLWRPRSP
jgi:hypothetical protein